MIKNATMGDIRRCKKRGISENFLVLLKDIHVIINLYEKTQKTYEGFVACSNVVYLPKRLIYNR
jgi:hypothetical protein